MTQSTYWFISSVNLICMLVLTLLNILITRQTTKKINYLARLNSVELKQHEVMVQKFVAFLDAVDETKLRFPATMEDQILNDEAQREAIFSELRKYRSEAETAYYQLKLVSAYSQTDFKPIEEALEAIMGQYRAMHDKLFEGLIAMVQYYAYPPEHRPRVPQLLNESTNSLADYSKIYSAFSDGKASFVTQMQDYMEQEIRQIRKDLEFD